MADDIQGAENDVLDAPPASGEDVIDTEQDDEQHGRVGAGDREDAHEPENEGEDVDAEDDVEDGEGAPADGRERFIPRERFDELNNRLKQIETESQAQKQERERQEAERREALEKQQAEIAFAQRALKAGYHDVAQFKQDDEWAKANNYNSVEDLQELRRLDSELQSRGIDDQLRADLLRDKQERQREKQEWQRERQELAQVRGLLRTVQQTTLDQTIASARAEFADVDPAQWAQIERLCRDVGNPEGVRRVIETFAPVIKASTKEAGKKAVIESNARRSANGNGAPSPEGRGQGNAPAQGVRNFQDSIKVAKANKLSDLLGFRG